MTFLDARAVDTTAPVESDVCIVGGGAAGITLACDLLRRGLHIALIESGGQSADRANQRLYAGRNIGLPSYPLSQSRVRSWGGSTTQWAAQCRMMERLDFERREWIDHSGWPFDLTALLPYYERAAATCHLTDFDVRDPERLPDDALSLTHPELRRVKFGFGHPTDFGTSHGETLRLDPRARVYLHANAVALELDDNARQLRSIAVRTLNGRSLAFRARAFVLAAGGIENPRLMLASRSVASAGVGNQHDLVGRYFMDHPYITTGYLVPADARAGDGHHVIRTFKRVGWEQTCHSGFTLSEAVQQGEALSGCVAYFIRRLASETTPDYYNPGNRARNRLRDAWRFRSTQDVAVGRDLMTMAGNAGDVLRTYTKRAAEIVRPKHLLALRTVVETTPRPDSRVLLDTRTDALGQHCAMVDWRTSDSDRRGLDRLRRTLAEAFAQQGLGQMVDDWSLNESGWPPSMEGGRHHMGTTRMHADPHQGVVDETARVHGVANLYVAGSSVFPTGSYVNPTLTIVALAHRLGDHLSGSLKGTVA